MRHVSKMSSQQLEELCEKIRKGELVDMVDALAAIDYQMVLQAQRRAKKEALRNNLLHPIRYIRGLL